MRSVTLLGSTGSIGVSTLDVIRRRPEMFGVYALVAGHNADLLADQIMEFRPRRAVLETESGLEHLPGKLSERGLPRADWPELSFGPAARVAVATAPETDFVLSAIVGVAGLEATYEAVRAGKQIGLANKETLVAGGALVMQAARQAGVELIPVDSEHNGAHQCFRAGRRHEVTRLILTASGGPFRLTPKSQLASVTPAQALKHPTWKMGQRITIDSATMMNKGFEVIEACWLFDLPLGQVDLVVHPQSSVHAMVEYNDGSVVAQLSTTDMRMPIQYALTYPDRLEAPVPRMNWAEARTLEFFPPDPGKFPLLRLAYEAQRTGGTATCTLNAADEVAVDAFLKEEISYPGIAEVVEETLNRVPAQTPRSVAELLDTDLRSRQTARQLCAQRGNYVRL
ncbi:MAG: 1-deoxy-D-xylulose-5-phosphate reductoisomerase [Acidobacteria bacterium]|nr:1-deoxy-D-xylulose-5-phosphate reductoisomerase [Acidobacteriota bacterium]